MKLNVGGFGSVGGRGILINIYCMEIFKMKIIEKY